MSHWRVDLSWDTNTLVDGVVHIVNVLGLNRDKLESKKLKLTIACELSASTIV